MWEITLRATVVLETRAISEFLEVPGAATTSSACDEEPCTLDSPLA
jgi:hypothetical protein